MDELERAMERAEGDETAEALADQDTAADLKDAETDAETDAERGAAADVLRDADALAEPDTAAGINAEAMVDPCAMADIDAAVLVITDAASDVLRDVEAFAEPGAEADVDADAYEERGAVTEFALEPGGELVQGGSVGAEGLARVEVPAAAEERTLVCLSAATKQKTKVGAIDGAEEPTQDDAAAGGRESAEAAEDGGGLEAEWKRRADGYALRAVFSEARAAAAVMGVPENRLDHVARLADLSGIGPEEEGAGERIAAAVRAVLKELPEVRGGVGTGQATNKRKFRRDPFERGFLGE